MATLCPGAERSDAAEWSLGGILRAFLPEDFDALRPALGKRRLQVLRKLAACGQPDRLGFNVYCCKHCSQRHCVPRSCGDRHCPRCLAGKSRQWLERQMQSLLPVSYYHGVFTLPPQLHPLLYANQRQLYPLLFKAAAQSLLEFGRHRLHGDIGITCVLHTWGQQLNFHPHLHCIITGGALSADGRQWRSPKQGKFLFPVRALAALFRGKFLAGLKTLWQSGQLHLPDPELQQTSHRQRLFSLLYGKRWKIHIQAPFAGPSQILRYLSNYTHRVAVSNRRIIARDERNQTVTFTYRDYRDGSRVKPLKLPLREFISRFALHILPPGLVRIRHYGILANNRRKREVLAARQILARRRRPSAAEPQCTLPPDQPLRCPRCGEAALRLIGFCDRHGVFHPLRKGVVYLDSS